MAGPVVKGTITVDVDIDEVEARVAFTPDVEGRAWDAEAILKKLGDAHLAPLPSSRAIEDLIQKFGKLKEGASATVVRGVMPVAPTGEEVAWEDHPIPDDLADLVKETLQRAPPPELYRIRVEKIKRETVTRKPGALPFLPAKQELVVSWDKKEIRERVSIDPEAKFLAYVNKGMKLGTCSPPKPGKPGKSVFGKPIPATFEGDGLFLAGEGVERDKSELRAAVAGIVRIGSNWVDIVPLARPNWSVNFGVDGVTVYLRFEPGDKRLPKPLATDILTAAVALGMPENDLVTEADIEEAIDSATRKSEPLEAFALSRKADAVIRVDISSDKLRALLYLRKGVAGGYPLELRAISEAIKNSRVRGFKAETLKADILAFIKGPATELAGYLLAEGTPPKRGKDREIRNAVPFLTEEARNELIRRLVTIPRADIPSSPEKFFPATEATDVAYIDRDALVASVSTPPIGAGGVDVFGTELGGLPGNDPDIRLFDGLRMSRNDILADVSGVLLVKYDGVSFMGRVVPYKDSRIEVRVSENGMKAWLSLKKEIGAGKPLTAEAVSAAIAEAGIVKGLDNGAVADAILKAIGQGSCEDALIAAGERPVEGGGTSLKWLIRLADGKSVSISGDGHADFKNQNKFTAVTEGTAIAEIMSQGAAGRAGFEVTGKILDPETGASVAVTHDDSIREEAIAHGVRLIATKAGELLFDGASIRIKALHTVKNDVDVSTGNINFPGEIRIGGTVKAGFTVIGAGDVLIAGSAESSLVSAGGKAVIAQGVVGAGKGIIRSRRGIEAGFVEQATLLAVEAIRVKNGCLQCHVKTNGKLHLMGEKGHLIGGFCRAREGVEAANIGSERGTRTEISFGQDYLVKDQIEVAEREAEKIKAALAELEKRLKQLESIGANLEVGRAEKVRLMKLLEKNGIRLFTLREKFEEHHQSEVRVNGTIFPGVVMESHGRYYEINQKRSKVAYVFDREIGRIQERPLK